MKWYHPLLTSLFLAFSTYVYAQVAWTEPFFPRPGQQVTVFFDASQGTGGLKDCNCTVYVHTGIITNQSTSDSDWKNVPTTWGQANAAWAMSPVAGKPNVYKYELKPSIQGYYGAGASVEIRKMAFVFRNAAGNREGKDAGGKDIFLEVFSKAGLLSKLLSPTNNPTVKQGESIPIKWVVSDQANLSITDNDQQVTQSTGTSLDYNLVAGAPGVHQVRLIAAAGMLRDTQRFSYLVAQAKPAQDPPAGTPQGISFPAADRMRLSLFAPGKKVVYAIGDFNNWAVSDTYQLTPSVDGNTHWIDITGIKPGEIQRFQYLVDGSIRIADPYSNLVLDPSNDQFIPAGTYPNLPAYPRGLTTGIVSLVEPGKAAYPWKNATYARPAKEKLSIYELLIRDFAATRNYKTLQDSLGYFQRLGINAIQLMPVNEFEGNLSWGYNPSYHMALDKYYGTVDQFKSFIDACHARGIAVIVDVVFNHAFGQSPLARLYWDEANNRPAANNPWLNPAPTHDFNVGNDFNHESAATRAFVKRVLKYWLEEFKIDGFRFDLSKGFTQKQTLGNVGLWSSYDQSRIDIWKDYAAAIRAVDKDAYIILEHFADSFEESELIRNGMMVWGNLNGQFSEATMGYTNDLSNLDYRAKGFPSPGAVNYMESHDEERLMYRNLNFGNTSGAYSAKDLKTALRRVEAASILFYTMPGPKMLWQFGEMGYDISINACEGGGVNNNCRLDNKPPRWNYLLDNDRKRLFDVTRAMLFLRKNYPAFHSTDYSSLLGSSGPKQVVLRDASLNVLAAANMGMTATSIGLQFPNSGKWYEYFSGDSITVGANGLNQNFAPGDYRLYTSKRLPAPPRFISTVPTQEVLKAKFAVQLFPNPSREAPNLSFDLPQPAQVRLTWMNALGQVVKQELPQQLGAGKQQLQLSKPGGAGQYWLRMQIGQEVLQLPFTVVE